MTAYAGQPLPSALEPETPHPAHRASSADEALARSPASYLWAALLARIIAHGCAGAAKHMECARAAIHGGQMP